jgi:sugar lactone lactonase YvrE
MDSSGNLFVADTGNNAIRKISSSRVVTTLAGQSTAGIVDATGTNAKFSAPWGIAVDASGNVFVGDSSNNRIRKIASGVVTTFAGQATAGLVSGTGTSARFNNPRGLAFDASGNLFVADFGNNAIRKITSAGVVTTWAGQATSGFTSGTGTNAQFNGPSGLSVDSFSNIFVADTGNNAIRKITSAAAVTTFAGQSTAGSTDATGTNARFSGPSDVTIGATGELYVADTNNNLIRTITTGGVTTTLAGNTVAGFVDGTGTSARFDAPLGLVFDQLALYVSDNGNTALRLVS